MKNIFIITLGTREVQFRKDELIKAGFSFPERGKGQLVYPAVTEAGFIVAENENYPDFLVCSEPRFAGKKIIDNWELFSPLIKLPLIQHAYDTIVKDFTINRSILVYTDQSDLDISNEQHRRNFYRDTVYFREIIRKKLHSQNYHQDLNESLDLAIENQATDIDYQYKHFAHQFKTLFEDAENINQVFLLAQGGIDQINHALTLQLIQAFGTKVKLWQQAEGVVPHSLEFPFLFIQDLNRQKLLEHLKNFNFNLIDRDITNNDDIIRLAEYAYAKLNINYTAFPANVPAGLKEKTTLLTRCKDLYLSAKINKKNNDFGNYLWKMFSLLENLYRINCIAILGEKNHYKSEFEDEKIVNHEWIDLLKSIKSDLNNKTLYDHLLSIRGRNGRPLKINNPNRHIYRESFLWLCINRKDFKMTESKKRLLTEIEKLLTPLSNKRNKLAHELEPVNIQNLHKIMGTNNIEKLDALFDTLFELESPYGLYDRVVKEILTKIR